MGRVKQLFNEYWEEKLTKMEIHQRQLELDLAQDDLRAEEWAQHEKDFNAWLDAYEKSFGTRQQTQASSQLLFRSSKRSEQTKSRRN